MHLVRILVEDGGRLTRRDRREFGTERRRALKIGEVTLDGEPWDVLEVMMPLRIPFPDPSGLMMYVDGLLTDAGYRRTKMWEPIDGGYEAPMERDEGSGS